MWDLWRIDQRWSKLSGHSPATENCVDLCKTWVSELWRWLMIPGLKQPCSLGWVSIHCNIRHVLNASWRVKFYHGIISVGGWLNLGRRPNSLLGEALNNQRHYRKEIGRCSHYWWTGIARCLCSRFIWHRVWNDTMRWMAWFLSGASHCNTSSAWAR